MGGNEGWFSRDPAPVFSSGGHCEQFWRGQESQLFDIVHPVFPLPTTTSPSPQVALQDGFGESVLACYMPEPCQFPSLDSCQKRFLWTHGEAVLIPQSVVGLVLKKGDGENFSHALGFERLDLCS